MTCTTERAAKEQVVCAANCSLSGKVHSLSFALESLSAKNSRLMTENEAVKLQLAESDKMLKIAEAQVCCFGLQLTIRESTLHLIKSLGVRTGHLRFERKRRIQVLQMQCPICLMHLSPVSPTFF
jgi:hypothetical protein